MYSTVNVSINNDCEIHGVVFESLGAAFFAHLYMTLLTRLTIHLCEDLFSTTLCTSNGKLNGAKGHWFTTCGNSCAHFCQKGQVKAKAYDMIFGKQRLRYWLYAFVPPSVTNVLSVLLFSTIIPMIILLPGVVYKCDFQLFNIFPMETLPGKLDVLCKQYGISFFDLRIRCVFCNHWCSTIDLAAFHHKCLCLLWKNSVCYACCSACLRLSAKHEQEKYYQCFVSSDLFEDVVCQPLQAVVIRCLICLAKLDYIEKLEHKNNKRVFHLVRGYWRALCRNCSDK